MKKKLCCFYLGPKTSVRLYVTDKGDGGRAGIPYNNGTVGWDMQVGIAKDWVGTLACFLHECEEVFLIVADSAYHKALRWSKKSDDREFFFNHTTLTEMNTCVADALEYVEPKLKKVWKEFRKKKRRIRKAKRKKK